MQQQEIDLAQAQPHQAVARRAFELARGEMRRPDFRGHEHLLAPDAGGVQPLAHLAFVIVHLGGVDVTVAEAQRLLDDPRTCASPQLPGAQPDERNTGALRFDGGGGCIRADGGHGIILLGVSGKSRGRGSSANSPY